MASPWALACIPTWRIGSCCVWSRLFISSESASSTPPFSFSSFSYPRQISSQSSSTLSRRTLFIASSSKSQVATSCASGMRFFSTPQSSSSPPDDELAEHESIDHRDHPNAMSSSNRSARTFLPFGSSTLASPGPRMFPFPGRVGTGTSGAIANIFGSAANTPDYHFNTSTYSVYSNGHMGLNITSSRDFPYPSEEPTIIQSMMDNMASQNYYSTTDPVHHDSDNAIISTSNLVNYELQPGSSYSNLVHNTVQGGVGVWYSGVTDGNPPSPYMPPMQDSNGFTPYPTQYTSANTDASSSSYYEPSSYRRELSAHYPETYHGSWQQWKDPTICDPQAAGSSLPEPPVPFMKPSTSAAVFSHSRIDHGDGPSNPSYRPPSTQPHQEPHRRKSRSRQNPRHRRRSHPYSPSTSFSCGWLLGENMTCTFEGPLEAFKTHFRHSHLEGAQNAPHECRWQGCKYRKRNNAAIRVMRRDSMFRHVLEKHFGKKRIV